MFFMPESQRWLARKYQHEECKEVLERVYDEDVALFELKQLKKEVHKMRHYIRQSECERYRQLFSIYKKCLLIGCGCSSAGMSGSSGPEACSLRCSSLL